MISVKQLNNKGFAISTILYGLLVVMILLMTLLMSTMSFARNNNKKFVEEIIKNLDGTRISTKKIICKKKEGGVEFTPGEEINCDVNGDSQYVTVFNYITSKDNKAILISKDNLAGVNTNFTNISNSLKTATQSWTNVTNPVRLLRFDEVNANCNPTNTIPVTVNNSLNAYCAYLANSTYWLETSIDANNAYFINSSSKAVASQNKATSMGLRSVIEVDLENIE